MLLLETWKVRVFWGWWGIFCSGCRGAARTLSLCVSPPLLAVTLYSLCSRWFLRNASWRRVLRGSPAWQAATSAPQTPLMRTSQFLPNRSILKHKKKWNKKLYTGCCGCVMTHKCSPDSVNYLKFTHSFLIDCFIFKAHSWCLTFYF